MGTERDGVASGERRHRSGAGLPLHGSRKFSYDQFNHRAISQFGSCRAINGEHSRIAGFTHVPDDVDAIKSAIMEYGSLSAPVDCTGWHEYRSGIFNGTTVRSVNHAVNLVGWGVDAATDEEYWLLRNSWGPEWGEQGYMRAAASSPLCPVFTELVIAAELP